MKPTFRVYAEDWAPAYGPAATFELDGRADASPAESAAWEMLPPQPHGPVPVAFVDGTRRVEMGLWQLDPRSGQHIRGIAGVYAVGATVCRPGVPAAFAGERRARLCIWAGGVTGDLGPVAGYHWISQSLATADPDAPLQALQNLMRDAEGRLATDLARLGWQVVLDGPLNRIRSLRAMIAGYAKTHHRQLLPDPQHQRVPGLPVGHRSPLWALGDDRFTCYLRVGAPTGVGSPWSGVVRLEFPSFAGLDAARDAADRLASVLPSYAGRHHLDPRAPQNLQPVRALEQHLGRFLGTARLARQAARAAIAHLQIPGPSAPHSHPDHGAASA
jgi:hypothetical protein